MSLSPRATIIYTKFKGDYNAWLTDFAARAKIAYPTWTELHYAIEHNLEIAGLMLDDGSYLRYNIGKVLLPASEQQTIENNAALYEEWLYTWRRNGLENTK